MLARIQNDLFDLGADLSTPEVEDPKYPPLRIASAQIDRLEAEIDALNAELQPLNSFILPGGKPTAAQLHLARTVSRRAEREITRAAALEPINPDAIRYINRLSDHLFVMARWVNDKGAGDVLGCRARTGNTNCPLNSVGFGKSATLRRLTAHCSPS